MKNHRRTEGIKLDFVTEHLGKSIRAYDISIESKNTLNFLDAERMNSPCKRHRDKTKTKTSSWLNYKDYIWSEDEGREKCLTC